MKLTVEKFLAAAKKSKSYELGGQEWEQTTYAHMLRRALVEHEMKLVNQMYCKFPAVWGNWRLGLGCPLSLDYVPAGYEITLDRLDSIEKVVHWVGHLKEKVWFNPPFERSELYDADSAQNFFRAIVTLNDSQLL